MRMTKQIFLVVKSLSVKCFDQTLNKSQCIWRSQNFKSYIILYSKIGKINMMRITGNNKQNKKRVTENRFQH
jgi:hypothetical protein